MRLFADGDLGCVHVEIDYPWDASTVLPGDPHAVTLTFRDGDEWTFSADWCEACHSFRPRGQVHTCKRHRSWRARLGRLCARLRRLVGVKVL